MAEALALLAVAVVTVGALLSGRASSGGLSAGVVLLSLATALLLLAAARALAAGRRWGRAPVLTWQLLQLAVALPAVRADAALIPVALLAASIAGAVGLFLPAVVRHTTADHEPPAL